jgi:O-antigen ligase
LILGTSITSFVAAVVGLFVIVALKHKIGIVPVILCAGLAIYLFNPNVDWIANMAPIDRTPEGIISMSGRTYLWEQYKEMIAESPFYGGGFAIGSRLADFYAGSTHNFIYSILLGTGLLGMIVFIIYLIRLIYEAIETYSNKYIGSIGCAGALACGLINSLGLPIVGDQWMTGSFTFTCISALFVLFILLPHRHMVKYRLLEIMNSGSFHSNNGRMKTHTPPLRSILGK